MPRPLASGLCAIIAAYEAERTVGDVVRDVQRFGFPVLVVDDGSSDGTSAAAREAGAAVLLHERNRGKGAALRAGFAWALEQGYSALLTIDADGQHDPSFIPELVQAYTAGQADLVIGSRAEEFGQMQGLRRFFNGIGVGWVNKVKGYRITDSQSGFRLIRGAVLEKIRLTADGYEMEMELLLKILDGGGTVVEVPVRTKRPDGRSTSHYRPVVDTYKICMIGLRSLHWWRG